MTFIMLSAAQQRHVLRRLGVFVVQLLGAESVGGQADVGPDLVEQRATRDAEGLAPLAGRPLRRLAAGRVGDPDGSWRSTSVPAMSVTSLVLPDPTSTGSTINSMLVLQSEET